MTKSSSPSNPTPKPQSMLSINEAYPIDLDSLDAGIRPWVEMLREENVHTFESCEGGEGHAVDKPVIRFHGDAWAGFEAFAIAMRFGMPVMELSREYGVVDGHLEGPNWQMIFRHKAL